MGERAIINGVRPFRREFRCPLQKFDGFLVLTVPARLPRLLMQGFGRSRDATLANNLVSNRAGHVQQFAVANVYPACEALKILHREFPAIRQGENDPRSILRFLTHFAIPTHEGQTAVEPFRNRLSKLHPSPTVLAASQPSIERFANNYKRVW